MTSDNEQKIERLSKKRISRRDLLKISAAGTAGVALVPIIAGCTPAATATSAPAVAARPTVRSGCRQLEPRPTFAY